VTKKDIGSFFENKVKEAGAVFKSKNDGFFYRFQDTKAARNITASAPADFLLGVGGEAVLLECKASEIHYSLSECLAGAIREGQLGYAHEWEMSGNVSWYLFYSDLTGEVHAWEGWRVIKARHQGKKLEGRPVYEFGLSELSEHLPRLFE
jgi:hypothetical protein